MTRARNRNWRRTRVDPSCRAGLAAAFTDPAYQPQAITLWRLRLIAHPHRDILKHLVRRADRAFLPTGNEGHVLAGEQVRSVALQQHRETGRARRAAPLRPAAPTIGNVLPRHRDTSANELRRFGM